MSGPIEITSEGSFDNLEGFLKRANASRIAAILEPFAQEGVAALSNATPIKSGETAHSWSYEIEVNGDSAAIHWKNNHIVAGQPLVLLLHYGHGTGTGGYVQGKDFIMPAITPIMDKISEQAWKAVTS